jgi:hypothetical protein
VPRVYQTEAEAVEAAYRCLLQLESQPVEDGYRRFDDNPAEKVASQIGWSISRAGQVLRKLKEQGLYANMQVGRDFYWLVKLPEGNGAQQRLDIPEGENHPPEVVAIEAAFSNFTNASGEFAKAYAGVHAILQSYPEVVRERDEALVEVESLRARMADLQEQHDQVIQTLGRLDEDVLRAIIQNAQKTLAD